MEIDQAGTTDQNDNQANSEAMMQEYDNLVVERQKA
jgi:hypothetical protein